MQHLLQRWAGEHLFNEEVLTEYGFYNDANAFGIGLFVF
jgi:hypothetical protein